MSTLGDNIKAERSRRHMSQADLATILSKSQTVISMYETGAVVPTFDVVEKIADAFDMSIDDLSGRSVTPKFLRDLLGVTS